MVSSPPFPLRRFARLLPTMVSPPWLPSTFSKPDRVSVLPPVTVCCCDRSMETKPALNVSRTVVDRVDAQPGIVAVEIDPIVVDEAVVPARPVDRVGPASAVQCGTNRWSS